MWKSEQDFYYTPGDDHCWIEAVSHRALRWSCANFDKPGRTFRWSEMPMLMRALHAKRFRVASGPPPEHLCDYADQMEVVRRVHADGSTGDPQVALETLVELRSDALSSADPRSQRIVKPEIDREMRRILDRSLETGPRTTPTASGKVGFIGSFRRAVHQLDTTLLRVAASIVLALELIRIIRSVA
jgi:hypothetical protein